MRRYLLLLSLITFFTLAHADWPTFSFTPMQQLDAQGYIDHQGCPLGEGKFRQSKEIPVEFFSRYAPHWFWHYEGTGRCFWLRAYPTFHHFMVYRFRDPITKLIQYSIVTVTYMTARYLYVTLKLETQHNHWDCYEQSPEHHTIVCANDV